MMSRREHGGVIRSLPSINDFVLLRHYNDHVLVQILDISKDTPHEYQIQIITGTTKEFIGEVKWTTIMPRPNNVGYAWTLFSLEQAEAYIARMHG